MDREYQETRRKELSCFMVCFVAACAAAVLIMLVLAAFTPEILTNFLLDGTLYKTVQ